MNNVAYPIAARILMVKEQLCRRGIKDERFARGKSSRKTCAQDVVCLRLQPASVP